MYCTDGRTLISTVYDILFELLDGTLPEERLARMFPKADLKQENVANQLIGWLQRRIFNDTIRSCGSLAVTSPTGVTLKISVDVLEEFSAPVPKEALGISSAELGYIFVQPRLFYVSTALWQNAAKEIYRERAGEDFIHLEILAAQLEKFEGWGLSISDDHVPRDLKAVEELLKPWQPSETATKSAVGRPNKLLPTAAALGTLYPDPLRRPAWKVVRSDLAKAGHQLSEATARRAWSFLAAQNGWSE